MPRPTRQILLVNLLRSDDEDESSGTILNSVALGSWKQVVDLLARFNTAPDGGRSPESFGLLYGPGMIVQMPMTGPDDPVMQVGISLHEEEMAWPVLMRACKTLGWRMMDPSSGRTFG